MGNGLENQVFVVGTRACEGCCAGEVSTRSVAAQQERGLGRSGWYHPDRNQARRSSETSMPRLLSCGVNLWTNARVQAQGQQADARCFVVH